MMGFDLSKLIDPEKIVNSILPIEITVKLKIYRAKDGSYVLQILPVEGEAKQK